ncbi:MAG: hypothetical protein ACKOHG_03960 [Planctomycetia bacterium]
MRGRLDHHVVHPAGGSVGFRRTFGGERSATIPARWHWHLEILPRINGLAGFELGAGCHITTVSPRDSARLLREA